MGQAKRRGTFEQRKAESQQRHDAERDRRRKELDAQHEAYRAAHPNEPERPARRMMLPLMLALAGSMWPTERSKFRNR